MRIGHEVKKRRRATCYKQCSVIRDVRREHIFLTTQTVNLNVSLVSTLNLNRKWKIVEFRSHGRRLRQQYQQARFVSFSDHRRQRRKIPRIAAGPLCKPRDVVIRLNHNVILFLRKHPSRW